MSVKVVSAVEQMVERLNQLADAMGAHYNARDALGVAYRNRDLDDIGDGLDAYRAAVVAAATARSGARERACDAIRVMLSATQGETQNLVEGLGNDKLMVEMRLLLGMLVGDEMTPFYVRFAATVYDELLSELKAEGR